jgi:hypothetical protein
MRHDLREDRSAKVHVPLSGVPEGRSVLVGVRERARKRQKTFKSKKPKTRLNYLPC